MNRRLVLKSIILATSLPFSFFQEGLFKKKLNQLKLTRIFESVNSSIETSEFDSFIKNTFDAKKCMEAHQDRIDSGDILFFKRSKLQNKISFLIHFKNEQSYERYQNEMYSLITDDRLFKSKYKITDKLEYT